jgi:hypothetical protein
MTEAQLELFRRAILLVLEQGTTRFGLTQDALTLLLAQYGFAPELWELGRELQYCADKGWVAQANHPLNPRNLAWRITAAGRDVL